MASSKFPEVQELRQLQRTRDLATQVALCPVGDETVGSLIMSSLVLVTSLLSSRDVLYRATGKWDENKLPFPGSDVTFQNYHCRNIQEDALCQLGL